MDKTLGNVYQRAGMVDRRTLLGALTGIAGMTALTGCLWDSSNGSSLTIQLNEVPREQLGQSKAYKLEKVEPRAREIVREGLINGTTVYGTKPLEAGTFVLSDGSYYAVRVMQNGTETVERPVLDAERVAAPNGSVSDSRELSRSDTLTLKCAVSTHDRQDTRPCVIFAGNHSVFWPELQVQYFERGDETYYRLRTSEQTVTLDRYDYTFERVARNQSSFADYIAQEQVEINFTGAAAKQRDILRTAANEGMYRESPPYSAALEALVDRVRSAGDERTVYVRFNGTYYEASVVRVFDD